MEMGRWVGSAESRLHARRDAKIDPRLVGVGCRARKRFVVAGVGFCLIFSEGLHCTQGANTKNDDVKTDHSACGVSVWLVRVSKIHVRYILFTITAVAEVLMVGHIHIMFIS